jgi:NAD(P)-dependent dehydrogenase (short-subunit alcohol dehydrogenase family)
MRNTMPTVLVTGAAGGIGKAICLVFLEKKYRVIGVDYRKAAKLPYEVLHFDVSRLSHNDAACESFCRRVEEFTKGHLDVLVNNAAVQIVKPIQEISVDDWDVTLETNLLAPFWLVRHFLSMLRIAKGSVVNIASIHAAVTKSNFTVYATSKGALVALTRSLAIELAPDIRVNALLPAATDTSMLRAGFEDNLDGLKTLGKYHPLARISQPEEIAQVALFLASPQASFMTGAAVNVDGGISACLHDPVAVK